MNLDNKIVCMNKIDLVKKEKTISRINKFRNYLIENDTVARNSLIVPMAGNYRINNDVLCQYICEQLDEPERDLDTEAKIIIVRSFNVNRPNTKIKDMLGGVVGGTVMKGILKVGDQIEILPGLVKKSQGATNWQYFPIRSKVMSIKTGKTDLEYAIPGGLVGIQLTVDPGLTIKDGIIGNIARVLNENREPENYKIYERIRILFEIIRDSSQFKINKNEILEINHNATNVRCKVTRKKGSRIELQLEKPICSKIGEHIAISRRSGRILILLGRGEIVEGEYSEMLNLE